MPWSRGWSRAGGASSVSAASPQRRHRHHQGGRGLHIMHGCPSRRHLHNPILGMSFNCFVLFFWYISQIRSKPFMHFPQTSHDTYFRIDFLNASQGLVLIVMSLGVASTSKGWVGWLTCKFFSNAA